MSLVGPVPVRRVDPDVARRGPAVLLYHGLRVSTDTLDEEGRAIARAGMSAVLVDAPHHGARRSAVLDTMPDTSTREGYRTLLRILREARDEVPALVDRLLDEGHEKVAIAGVSMGAYIALAAASIEPRLAAVASLLGSPDWTPHEGEAAANVSELAEALRESPALRAEAFPPRPLLLLNGARDVNVPPGPARAFAALLRPRYAELGHADALVHREYDVDHFPPPTVWSEMTEAMVTFLARALGVA